MITQKVLNLTADHLQVIRLLGPQVQNCYLVPSQGWKETMNIAGFIVSSLIFILALKVSDEIWFDPEKYINRVNTERKILRTLLGFSYWNENRINMPFVKTASILILLGCLLGMIVSVTGPIKY